MRQPFFICPVCRAALSDNGRSFSCGNGHSYDISREGYINLLLANQKHSREPGDSKEMVSARKSFLESGHYQPLADSVYSCVRDYCSKTSRSAITILDAGCGEGYYTASIASYASKELGLKERVSIYGIDISKDGIRLAAKRCAPALFAVAGIYSIPAADTSADVIINIFSPFSGPEFSRVLADDGIIISVAPGADHLIELKKNLYQQIFFNDEEFTPTGDFELTENTRLKFTFTTRSSEDSLNLIKMTPYYHKTSRSSIDRFITDTSGLDITADFIIRIIRKNSVKKHLA